MGRFEVTAFPVTERAKECFPMSHREFHVMTAELIEDRRTMRYTCAVCQRCVEDGPEGIAMIHNGDQFASHRGGSISSVEQSVEQEPPGGQPPSDRRLFH